MTRVHQLLALTTLLVLAAIEPALAHEGAGVAGGFTAGFTHPLFGPDHLVAMIAVGLWGAQLGNPAIWVLPIVFPMVMAVGGLIGISGVDLPFTEFMIAVSGVALGIAVASRAKAPLWLAGIVIGIFAIAHGYAHGRELPEAANPAAFAAGFVIATGLLHLTGILIGAALRWPIGDRIVRGCGAVVGCFGTFYLLTNLGAIS